LAETPEHPAPEKKSKRKKKAAALKTPVLDTISNSKELAAWLEGKPDEWARIVAVRSALRVLPLTFTVFNVGDGVLSTRNKKQLVLQAFRALFLSNVLVVYPSFRDKIGHATARAATVVGVAAAVSVGSSIAATATRAAAAAKATARADTVRAVDAAATAAAKVAIWAAVNDDINGLARRHEVKDLLNAPLWWRVLPEWTIAPAHQFASNDLVTDGPWGLVLAWYRTFLPTASKDKPRSLFGEDIDIDIAMRDEKFWDRDPDEVMKALAKITGWPDNYPQEHREILALAKGVVPDRSVDAVKAHSDEPTDDDILERRFFAQALVERMDEIYEQGGEDGFAVHLHAPWGAGKTSVLRLMDNIMTDKERNPENRWVCVHFNAWEHERRKPPWWPFLETLRKDCMTRLVRRGYDRRATYINLKWWVWKLKADWIPTLLAAAVALVVLYLLWVVINDDADTAVLSTLNSFLGDTGKSVVTILTLSGAMVAVFRRWLFGSDRNAKFYFDMSQNPMKRITDLFKQLVDTTEQPICIFIDDLDRCHADYAVELLEGVQTAFRHKNVAYVVAADRAWIKTSFETVFSKYNGKIGGADQPLGYLFLEKIFQVSTALPGVTDAVREVYWEYLLTGRRPDTDDEEAASENPQDVTSARQFDRKVKARRKEIQTAYGKTLTRKKSEDELADEENPRSKEEEAIDRIAFMLELNRSRAAEVEALHLLKPFVKIVSDNPRVMKRMLNAYALRLNVVMLDGGGISSVAIARWTILEQRFPTLADQLITHPDWIENFIRQPTPDEMKGLAQELVPYIANQTIREIVGAGEDDALTEADIHILTRGSRM
jgi:KAP-like P-loop domain-containing protein